MSADPITMAPGTTLRTRGIRPAALVAIAVLEVGALVGIGAAARAGELHPGLLDPQDESLILAQLSSAGLSPALYAGYRVLLELVVLTTGVVAAVALLRGVSGSPLRSYVAVVIVALTTAGGGALQALGWWWPPSAAVAGVAQLLAWIGFFTLAYVFPDGRFVPRWTRWLLPAWFMWGVGLLSVGNLDGAANALAAGSAIVLFGTVVHAAVHRYRRVSDAQQRQQTKWVLWAITLQLGCVVWSIIGTSTGLFARPDGTGLFLSVASSTLSHLATAAIAISLAVAVLRFRLFAIEAVISRTLLWGLLSAVALGLTAALAAGLGSLARPWGPVPSIGLAVVLVAVLIPGHRLLQRVVERIVYGARTDPLAVLGSLGHRLADDVASTDVVASLSRTVYEVLRPAAVRVQLAEVRADRDGFTGDAAADGSICGGAASFELRSGTTSYGRLLVWPRAGDPLRAVDRRLLARLAEQAAAGLDSVQLSRALQLSRERLVSSREDERQRLRRELHDGIGPTLASLSQRLSLAQRLLGPEERAAKELLQAAHTHLLSTIDELRTVVDGLRPPSLAELGLAAALEQAWWSPAEDASAPTVHLDLATLPPLSAATETAAFRITMESVTNAMRHARSRRIDVRLRAVAGLLQIIVEDDGVGLADGPAGVGIDSVRERADELGGSVTWRSGEHGTVVEARLPLTVPSVSL